MTDGHVAPDLAPGAQVVERDEEWRDFRVDATGTSELVRGQDEMLLHAYINGEDCGHLLDRYEPPVSARTKHQVGL